jgi:hypothetical protein
MASWNTEYCYGCVLIWVGYNGKSPRINSRCLVNVFDMDMRMHVMVRANEPGALE